MVTETPSSCNDKYLTGQIKYFGAYFPDEKRVTKFQVQFTSYWTDRLNSITYDNWFTILSLNIVSHSYDVHWYK